MTKDMEKAYEPKKYEDEIYKRWEESGFFNPDNLEGEPYSIMMPPPNVTGVLHLGHALENSLMDTMIRFQRMRGKKTLLLPGTDHAAVATQARVEKNLIAEGIEHPREHFGREGLLEKIREYAEESKATILNQIKKMGTSCDWSRLAYTFDEDRSKAVNTVFKKMHEDGLIYRGHRVVNWSVKGQSTCSDDELVHVERKAKLYTFKYSEDFPFTIATTRPETKLGDTAVAVHPKDKRYKKYIGKEYEVDFCGNNLKLKIITDEEVDPEFGTGALGVTPAHSPTDFEMYEKQKAKSDPIDLIQVIGEDGKMTAKAGNEFSGLSVEDAREKVVEYLKKDGLFVSEEEIDQNVGTSDRFGDVVEALPMTQWFVAVNKEIPGKGKTLKQLMKEAVEKGHNADKKQKINITPERFEKIYYSWIDNLRDWCISRQIWWGHRIPVWYCQNAKCKMQNAKNLGIIVSEEKIEKCTECGGGIIQDEDTLDTWFSSGLWTFSTLGWPEKTEDFKTFHPTNWMQMGYEILFFWMARMILMSTYTMDEIPFKDAYIHGMLRDKDGQKFSKSSGNGIDPLEVIEQYGTDALRYSLISGVTPGNDSKFYIEKVEGSRNLVNKLWNMSRFIMQNAKCKMQNDLPEAKTLADKWILSRLNKIINEVTNDIEEFRFSTAGEKLRDFIWGELADWYLEIAKIEGGKDEILNYILNTVLKLWHPFMPFVTETIWQEIYGENEMLMVASWPKVVVKVKETKDFDLIKNIVTNIRSLRADYKIEPAKKITIYTSNNKIISENAEVIKGLARIEEIKDLSEKPEGAVGFTEGKIEVYIDLAGSVDIEKEIKRIEKEIDKVAPFVLSLEKKLSNSGFVGSAPKEVVEKEKQKLNEAKEKLKKLQEQRNALTSNIWVG